MKERIRSICNNVSAAHECSTIVEIDDKYPAVINHKNETDHIIRLAKQHFGEEHYS